MYEPIFACNNIISFFKRWYLKMRIVVGYTKDFYGYIQDLLQISRKNFGRHKRKPWFLCIFLDKITVGIISVGVITSKVPNFPFFLYHFHLLIDYRCTLNESCSHSNLVTHYERVKSIILFKNKTHIPYNTHVYCHFKWSLSIESLLCEVALAFKAWYITFLVAICIRLKIPRYLQLGFPPFLT